MSARTRWRLTGAISVATTAALAAGLASTPAAAAVAPEAGQAAVTVSTPRTAGAFSVYVPHSGDTLWRISARFCGRGSYYPRLAAASGISNPDLIIAGRTRVVLACTRPAATARTTAPATTGSTSGWVGPLAGALVCSSRWGDSRDGGSRLHKGIDLPRPTGTPIRAVHAGRVASVRYSISHWDRYGRPIGAGWYITLDHGNNTKSVYMHMRSRSSLPVGASVRAGQMIGYVGSSGALAAHLHFEIRLGARYWPAPVNPAPYLRARGIALRNCG